MAVFKCKMCGGTIDVHDGEKVVRCDFCGTTQTVYSFDNEKKATYFKRANALRYKCQFDKAAGIYETIVSEFPNDAEAYWGLVLCKYGIEYVDDPKTGSKIPTCHRTQFSSIYDDSDYKNCIKNADIVSKSVYEKEAKEISKLQKSILEISSKEDPFDIFICYKESDNNGNRTPDSVLAQDIYKELTNEGYRVFFSRITLEDKLGSQYEPYIFAALHSSKVMIHVTTSDEYSESIWVRNEWSRYLSLISEGQKKTLIPCYKDISAYELPEEMQHLQGQDMSKLGAMQDLVRGVNKIIGKNKFVSNVSISSSPVFGTELDMYESQIRKGYIYLSKGIFKEAKEAFETAIKLVEKCGRAYIGLMLAEAQEVDIDSYLASIYSAYGTYKTDKLDLARSFADDKCLKELENIDAKIEKLMYKDAKDYFLNLLVDHKWNEAEEYLNKEKKYHDEFLELYKETKYRYLIDSINEKIDVKNLSILDDVIEGFNELAGYKDSDEKIRLCGELKTKILDDWNNECINNLAIAYPEEITLKSLDALARQINGNKAFIKSLDPCSDVIKNAYNDIQDDAYKFIEGNSYNLINSFSNLSDCSKLIRILSSLNKNGYFEKVFSAIFEQKKYIRDVEKQTTKKKVKKRLKIPSIVCAALAICTGVFFGIKAIVDERNRSNTYDSALKAMNSGDYSTAISYYVSLGDYKDSNNKIEICNGLIKLELSVYKDSEEYAIAGIKQIVTAGENVDVTYEAENNTNIKRDFNSSGNSGNKTETIDSVNFTLYKPTLVGYTFLIWSPTKVIYKDNRTSLDLRSNWSLTKYSINYELNGGKNNNSNPSFYTINDEVVFLPPTKTGYTFDGWHIDETEVSSIKIGTTGDLTLNAKWIANKNNLSVTSEDESKGTVSITSGAGYSDETITVLATPSSDYALKGWYSGETKVSNTTSYTFTMPTNDYSLVARFCSKAEKEEEKLKEKLGIIPVIDETNNTLTYGLYPQTHVNDADTITALDALISSESNGWYLYNDEYYVKKSANPFNSSYSFNDGTTIKTGTTYWFKCEPIVWKILSSSNGLYSLTSTVLLDAHRFASSSNNYKNSEIRSWLNDDFLSTAFKLDSSLIQITTVDNSASTTDSSSNKYACENTEDKVYLLSYQDYYNSSYCSSNSDRTCKPTDYALANHCYKDNGNGYYWTRSPSSSEWDSNFAYYVYTDGILRSIYVHRAYVGVRPALTISL